MMGTVASYPTGFRFGHALFSTAMSVMAAGHTEPCFASFDATGFCICMPAEASEDLSGRQLADQFAECGATAEGRLQAMRGLGAEVFAATEDRRCVHIPSPCFNGIP